MGIKFTQILYVYVHIQPVMGLTAVRDFSLKHKVSGQQFHSPFNKHMLLFVYYLSWIPGLFEF